MAIQGYKKALFRIHNLYQEDVRMYCRGQINSNEEKWISDEFKMSNNVRELYEYRLEKKKSILNGSIDYYTEQLKHYQPSSQDDSVVQLNLAFLYQHGYGVKKCTRWAFDYYTMAAEQGNTDTQYNLGELYQKHTKTKFNYRYAFKRFTESAQGGNITVQKSLAYLYLKGLVTDIDYTAALSWYLKTLAKQKDANGQCNVGIMYNEGLGFREDSLEASRWFTCAADQGDSNGWFNLGTPIYCGRGLRKDRKQGI